MSTIEVKGTKTEATEDTGRERFLVKDAESRSRLPIILALALTGIVAYLKSTGLGGGGRNEVQAATGSDREDRPAAPSTERVRVAELSTAEAEVDEEPNERFSSPVLFPFISGYGPKLIHIAAPTILELDSFTFDASVPIVPLGGPVQGPVAAGNDNAPASTLAAVAAAPPPIAYLPYTDVVVVETSTVNPPRGPAELPQPERNRKPVTSGSLRLNDVMAGQAVLIGLSQLLRHTVDSDADVLSVSNVRTSAGSIGMAADGWVFSSNRQSAAQSVTITYDISDGVETITQTATFNIAGRVPLSGTSQDDILLGLDSDDDIEALGGNDIIDARGGDDFIVGGDGDDHIIAGAGNDIVLAGNGNDVVLAGPGDDLVSGGAGNDRLYGEAGNDTIYGDDGDDHIDGGDGDDILHGGTGNDRIFGQDGADFITGGDGEDWIDGGPGNDLIEDGAGADTVYGGDGNDVVLVAMDGDDDKFYGGPGEDLLDLSPTTMGVVVDLSAGTAKGIEIGDDNIEGFETVVGGSGDDTFLVGRTAVTLIGGSGNDAFYFDVARNPDATTVEIIHKILDFMVGDQVFVADYEFKRVKQDGGQDRFERVYRAAVDDLDDDEFIIRLRSEATDQFDYAIIEVDRDDDDGELEFSIEIYGRNGLYSADYGVA